MVVNRIAETRQIVLNNQTVSYTLRRSPKALYLRLQIAPEGLNVVIPQRCSLKQLAAFMERKGTWILKHLERQKQKGLPVIKDPQIGDDIPYLGKKVQLCAGTMSCAFKLDSNKLLADPSLNSAKLKPALKSWYISQAKEVLSLKALNFADQMNVKFSSLTVRGARTRWGSCSPKGDLSFTWRLIMAPEAVIDYVVIHELSHIKQLNHSPKFWAVVSQYYPEWRIYRKWLRLHNHELVDFC